MKKVLFFINDLGQGGAERVLVNLVNHLDLDRFDVTVMTLFGNGENEIFLSNNINYQYIFSKKIRGYSHLLKLFSPKLLHTMFIKKKYDIEISFLEGPAARIISGCRDKNIDLVSWMHCTFNSKESVAVGFRNYKEAKKSYQKFKNLVFVSNDSMKSFLKITQLKLNCRVLYNTNDSDRIIEMSDNKKICIEKNLFTWCGVGKLIPIKAFDRLIRIQRRLIDNGVKSKLYILGDGSLKSYLTNYSEEIGVSDSVCFLGYLDNPYSIVKQCKLFVCSSISEGFSTAATEALILGVPVCTVKVSGMCELIGNNNEFGIVTENNEDSLFEEINKLATNPSYLKEYTERAKYRGNFFKTNNTVNEIEKFLWSLGES